MIVVIGVGPPAALTTILRALSLVPKAFVARNVAVRVVAVLGVPVIAPVDAFRISGLIDPLVMLHVIGAVPVATRVCE